MSTNKKWSVLLRVVLALVLVGVGVGGGYYLWGRSPVPQAFFERPGSSEAFPVRNEIFSLISNARQEVLAVQMEAGDTELLEALASVSADVSVRVITTHKNDTQFSQFKGTGLKIEYLETEGILHHKFIVVDGAKVLTGSYNWSQRAYERNWENAMVVTNRAVAESFQLEFEYLWDLARPPAASEPDPDPMSCLERLNAARFADLEQVKGIGDILALRILEYRKTNGSFATVDELSQVDGIGPALRSAILEKLCPSAP